MDVCELHNTAQLCKPVEKWCELRDLLLFMGCFAALLLWFLYFHFSTSWNWHLAVARFEHEPTMQLYLIHRRRRIHWICIAFIGNINLIYFHWSHFSSKWSFRLVRFLFFCTLRHALHVLLIGDKWRDMILITLTTLGYVAMSVYKSFPTGFSEPASLRVVR